MLAYFQPYASMGMRAMRPIWANRIKLLRRHAMHCRDLAEGAVPVGVEAELEALAVSYEAEADALERRRKTGSRRPPKIARKRLTFGQASNGLVSKSPLRIS